MAVSFPPEAAAQAASVDAWSVRVSRPGSEVLVEQDGTVGPLQTSVTVQVAVTLESSCETLSIRLELSSGGEVWFRSDGAHEICAGSGNALPAQQLQFVRPRPQWTPTSLDLAVLDGGSTGGSFEIRYAGADQLVWSAAVVGGSDWLNLPVSSGSVTAGQPQDVTVLADAANLSPGTYTGRVGLTAEGFPNALGSIDVVLVVSARPRLGVTPTSLDFTTLQRTDPPSKTFTVTNTGGGVLVWNVADDQAWFAASPSEGTLAAGQSQVVTASVSSTALPPGSYLAQVTVASPDAANSPVTIPATLSVIAAGFTLTESAGATVVDESGTTDDFTVVLDVQPTSDVVFDVNGDDPGEATVAPATLVFTPSTWNVARTVTVTGVDDPTVDGDQISTITVSVNGPASDPAFVGLSDATVSVTTTDDDMAGIGFTVVESAGATVVDESGTTDDVTVALDAQPMTDVVIDVSSNDTGEATVAPPTLTFTPTNWNVAQTVTVTGVDDPTVDGDQISTVRFAVDTSASDPAFASVPDQTISVTTVDDDVSGGVAMIAFASDRTGDWEIYAMNPDGSGTVNLSNSPSSDEQMPTWSPDRSQLAFTSNRDGNVEVYRMDADGSNQVNLTNNPATDQSPKWAPAGGLIAFETNRDGNSEIYTMDTAGGNQINRTLNPAIESKATWSPDGSRIAFDSQRSGNRDIWVMNADGSNPVQLTTDPAFDSEPAWSPDGSRIAFRSLRTGSFEIVVMNADGSNEVLITSNSAQEWNPTWSADSQRIVFSSDQDTGPGSSEIYVMDANGSNVVRLTVNSFFDWWPAWWN